MIANVLGVPETVLVLITPEALSEGKFDKIVLAFRNSNFRDSGCIRRRISAEDVRDLFGVNGYQDIGDCYIISVAGSSAATRLPELFKEKLPRLAGILCSASIEKNTALYKRAFTVTRT